MNGSGLREQGDIDTSFGNEGTAELRVEGYIVEPGASEPLRALARTADDKIMLAMGCRRPSGGWQYGLARLMPDGTFDPSFGVEGVAIEPPLSEETLQGAQPLPMAGGATVLVLRSMDSQTWMLTRRNAKGVLDDAFGIGGYVNLDGIRPPGEPRVVKGFVIAGSDDGCFFIGTTKAVEGGLGGIVFCFDAQGKLDPTFAGKGYALVDVPLGESGRITDALLQDDGKVVLSTATVSGNARIVRLLRSGVPDPAFGDAGHVVIDGNDSADRIEIEKLAWSNDAGLWGAGSIMTRRPRVGVLVRLDDKGTIPPSFNGGKSLEINYGKTDDDGGLALPLHIAISAEAGVTVVGSADHDGTSIKRVVVGRHVSSGELDSSFGDRDGYFVIEPDLEGFNFIFFGIDVTNDYLVFEMLSGNGVGGTNPDRVLVQRYFA